ncbi:hypothetical protein WG66_016222 [Moniliophthora roreri]|nr:hypothetical protein WG66_016222 [Moniliophthora roreri]
MTVAVETGMITVLGSVIQLAFFLAFRRKRSVHYALFYVLPQLYGNCMMAVLNIRQVAVPGKTMHDSNHQKIEEVMLQFGHLLDEPRRPFASAPASPKSPIFLRSHEMTIGKGSFLVSERDITDSWDNVAVSERVARFWYSYAIPGPTLIAPASSDVSPAKVV